MSKRSAGILPFRWHQGSLEVLLVHPGGPFWKRREQGAWSIAKGEYDSDEPPELAARREFEEETGWNAGGTLTPLGEVTQAGGKHVIAFALERDFEAQTLRSNLFEIEWPPRSGRLQSFPEVDRAAWFDVERARQYLLASQVVFVDRIVQKLV